ncbi:MAG: CoA transferase subunit A [Alphaproteobacteria bacterium]|nr:CoA transferase subunit A [Alphaproteobacteria bacterium]
MQSKLVSLKEAVAGFIKDGDRLVIGASLEAAIPFAATFELIRQNKRQLDLIAPISDASADMLIGAGCAGSITGAWVGNVSGGLGHNYRRAMEQGLPHPLKVNDFSNFSLAMALMAGAYGMPFVPVRSLLGSDITQSNPDHKILQNPLSEAPDPVVLVKPLVPDVAIFSVPRSDVFGNAHFWGSLGVVQEAALAAKSVILLADEIVEPAVIASDPNRVIFPGFKVKAVAHEPASQYPSPMTGCWKRDNAFFNDYHQRSRDREGYLAWLEEWVLSLPDHASLRAKLGTRLDDLRIKGTALAAPANFASE